MLDQTTENLMTLDEFIAEYHKQPFELIHGEKRLIMPNVAIHGWIVRAIFVILYNYSVAHKLGEVFQEMPFVELYSNSWVKGSKSPDLMFFSAEKWQQYEASEENWQRKPFVLVPDLVVEVVSPNDSYTELSEKIEVYQEQGIRLVWIFDPQRKRVEVYADEHYEKLTPVDVLKGRDVLPGLEIALNEIF